MEEFDKKSDSFKDLVYKESSISFLISSLIFLLIYKIVKYYQRNNLRKNSDSIRKLTINNHLSKPDLKPINNQFQINTAYTSKNNFHKLISCSKFKSPSTDYNLKTIIFNTDLEDGLKNSSFNGQNNLVLTKKFFNTDNLIIDKNSLSPEKKSLRSSKNSSESSDYKSEQSDLDKLINHKSQRLSNSRLPISIKFNLNYQKIKRSISIEILNVDNLIFSSKQCSFYVKISLRDNKKELRFKSQKTKVYKGLSSIYFNETKQFIFNTLDKIQDCTLQIVVYNRIRSLSRKHLIGDLLIDLNRPDIIDNCKLMFDEELTPICSVTGKKLYPTFKTGQLGFLQLELQLTNEKIDKHKIKITVKNGKYLPLNLNSNNSISNKPEFYLILNLLFGQEKLESKKTNSSFSLNPNWDQQIIFNINDYSAFDEKFILNQSFSANKAEISKRLFRSKLKHLSLQIKIYEGNLSNHNLIGQVKIGDKGSIDGILHWNEMCNTNESICKWHEIRTITF